MSKFPLFLPHFDCIFSSVMEEKRENSTAQFCPNCHFPLNDQSVFCQNCGQKNTDGRLTLKELFTQVADTFFNLDSKIFRTLGAVFIPGKLTNAYLNGKRNQYYHPIRLFLVLALILIAVGASINETGSPNDIAERIYRWDERRGIYDTFEKSLEYSSEQFDSLENQKVLDTLAAVFYANTPNKIDSVNINRAFKLTDDFDFYIELNDFQKYSAEELIDLYEVKGFYRRTFVQQKIKLIKEGTNFIPFVMGKATWAAFFLVILLAGVLKLLNLRKDFLYLEHLIFSVHIHAFFFILFSVLFLLDEETREDLLPPTVIVMSLYFLIALFRVYKQKILPTILKFSICWMAYLGLFIAILAMTIVGSFLLF